MITYIDDILVYSNSLKEHICHVRQVLQRRLQHNLYIKAEKCDFHQFTISFLGYTIIQEGVTMDQDKVKVVLVAYSPHS